MNSKDQFVAALAAAIVLLTSSLYAQSVLETAAGRSIKLKTLKRHVYTLAADSMEGRVTASPGYAKAVKYVEGCYRHSGLHKLLKGKNGRKTYRQGVPFWKSTEDDTGSVVIYSGTGKLSFKQGKDFKFDLLQNDKILRQKCPVVYVGYGIERGSYNDYAGLDLGGKVAVMISRVPKKGSALPDSLVQLYKGGRRSQQRLDAAASRGVVAVIRLADAWTAKYWKTFGDVLMDTHLRIMDGKGADQVKRTHLTVLDPFARAIFKNHAFMPLDSTNGIPPYLPSVVKGVSVRFNPGKKSGVRLPPNLVAYVPGTDPVLKKEYIVVGAHLDHIPPRRGEICNGADDNASGIASMLEVADAIALKPPKRSVCFIAFVAEELGLLGAKYFVDNSPIPLDRIKFMVNLDMMGRSQSDSDSARTHIAYYSNEGDGAVKTILEQANEETVNWAMKYRRAGSTRSDHYPFMQEDIPIVFYYSGSHRDYHRPTDDADKIDYEKLHALTRLVYGLVMKTGNTAGPLFEVE
ncbi:M20/M25/M40 family metallo-hydrolase [bacterium]|nr:M20/M25/M40 family metallo-hydrolase [bacterium]